MKKQIRSSVFETNSSSTHSIAISKAPVTVGKYISFNIGEYGWENDCVDIGDYLYTAILYAYSFEDAEEKVEHLKKVLNKYGVFYQFEEPEYRAYSNGEKYLDNGYIDHGEECAEFVEAVLNDEDMLMRCLFGNSMVYTGNDNQDNRPDGCNIANEEYYDWGEDKMVVNPYHDPENYDYFYKGN